MKWTVAEGFDVIPPPSIGGVNGLAPFDPWWKAIIDNLGGRRLEAIQGVLSRQSNGGGTLEERAANNTSFYTGTPVNPALTTWFGGNLRHHPSTSTNQPSFRYKLHQLPLVGAPVQVIDGIEVNFARYNRSSSFSDPKDIVIELTDGSERTFGNKNGTPAWLAWSTYPSTPVALSGDNAFNWKNQDWHKIHFQAWKSGSFLRVSVTNSFNAKVVYYEENIGSVGISSVRFATPPKKVSIDGIIDDMNIYEIEPSDIAFMDANVGSYNFKRHTRHYFLSKLSNYVQKTTNGDADTWGDYNILGDLTWAASIPAQKEQLGSEQLVQFDTIPLISFPDTATELVSIGFLLGGIDDGGSPIIFRMENGASIEERTVPTQNSDAGQIQMQVLKGSSEFANLAATISTNGMKFTARSI